MKRNRQREMEEIAKEMKRGIEKNRRYWKARRKMEHRKYSEGDVVWCVVGGPAGAGCEKERR